ncbi:hypothetical protein acsn021_03660 [Anaerocolumna cellulosilytica]|uniref:Uncharacterized protein n=1 Tax=Anaerocolumna cellulosilytica TaxID=433286 RepID=A0A6S6QY41_9FIRM|nr:hypothetical protein [Anaerocolumna cellulosilytica]MBB5197355.1 ribosomal protein L14E/L6E/L27E [Anaerocolumna cellulosilytica]BCJ92797.1 hypothetical protein acsn021_03660 [Anaerocolumna cellulosilytica]
MVEKSFGSIAISKAGHDKGEIFVILKSDSEYVYLLDGIVRTLEKPKKKNKKHIQSVSYTDSSLLDKVAKHEKVTNEDIKRAIKLYNKMSNQKQ